MLYQWIAEYSPETANTLWDFSSGRIRPVLSTAGIDSDKVTHLFHQKYCRSRYSFGYHASPDCMGSEKIFRLLDPEKPASVQFSEGYSREPKLSTNAILVHAPIGATLRGPKPRSRGDSCVRREKR